MCLCVLMCVCICLLLGWGYKVRMDLRNCNTYGINIPYDDRYYQHRTKPTISSFYGVFVEDPIGHKSDQFSHQHYWSYILYSLCFGKKVFFLTHLKTVLELNSVFYWMRTIESWILAASQKKISPQGTQVQSSD